MALVSTPSSTTATYFNTDFFRQYDCSKIFLLKISCTNSQYFLEPVVLEDNHLPPNIIISVQHTFVSHFLPLKVILGISHSGSTLKNDNFSVIEKCAGFFLLFCCVYGSIMLKIVLVAPQTYIKPRVKVKYHNSVFWSFWGTLVTILILPPPSPSHHHCRRLEPL